MADLPPRLELEQFTEETNLDVTIKPENNEAQIREQLFPNEPEIDNRSPRELINSKIESKANNPNSISSPQSPIEQNRQLVESTVAMTSPALQPNPQKLSQSLQKKEGNTSDEDARKNYVTWAATEVKSGTPQEQTLQGIYPKDACILRLEGSTTYGVMVNPQGKVIQTKLIKNSGYPLLNAQALKQIQASNFPNNSGVPQPYHVYVNFKYNPDICPSLSLNNLGKFPVNSSPSRTSSTKDDSNGPNPPIPPKSSPKIEQPSRAVNESKIAPESEVKSPSATTPNQNNTPPVKLPSEVNHQPATQPTKAPTNPSQPNLVAPTQPSSSVEVKPVKPKGTQSSSNPVKPTVKTNNSQFVPVPQVSTPSTAVPKSPVKLDNSAEVESPSKLESND
jgi:TonB family protein